MIPLSAIQDLQVKLPLLLGKIDNDNIEMLNFKWGGVDGSFHSAKGVIAHMRKDISIDDIRKIEIQAMEEIEKEMTAVFVCRECGADIRKYGLIRITIGEQRTEMFISSNGLTGRLGKSLFSPTSPGNQIFLCHSCERKLPAESPTMIFLNNGVTSTAVIHYVSKIKKIKIPSSLNRRVDVSARDSFMAAEEL